MLAGLTASSVCAQNSVADNLIAKKENKKIFTMQNKTDRTEKKVPAGSLRSLSATRETLLYCDFCVHLL